MASRQRKIKSIKIEVVREGESNIHAACVGRQQMYKKRLVKWGIQKNPRRAAASMPASTTTHSRKSSLSADLDSVPISPKLSNQDSLMLVVHTSVKMWSMSFYESVQSNRVASSLIRPSWPEQSQEMNVTFKLVIDMLNRGQGSLAAGWPERYFR